MTEKYIAKLEERLLRYVQIDTQSDEHSPTSPSTAKQYDLLNLLVEELKAIGAQDVTLTDYGAVLATIPATAGCESAPVVAFLGHVDTAPAFSGTGVKPIVHRHYDGGDIVLPDDERQVISPRTSPNLANKVGHDIVTASGTTLLGADDKAGVAIVMGLADQLLHNPAIAHGKIRVCLTPDEEIGRGVHKRLPADLGAQFAYTLDGGDVGEIVYESFSADKAVVTIEGVSAHTGTAKGVMVNALKLAGQIIEALPRTTLSPETTDGREGFIYLDQIDGRAAKAVMHFLLRDFELDGLKANGDLLRTVCGVVAAGEPRARIECVITPQYRNMRYWLEKDMRPVDLANEACRALGIEPFAIPIRGGTDGSRLTEMGVPTPNLFTGMHDLHGPQEWISLQDMALATQLCVNLAELWGKETVR